MSTPISFSLLQNLATEVRSGILTTTPSVAGRCEGAAGDIGEALWRLGHDAELVWGEYAHPCPQGYPTTGHCWVVVGGMIVDPTRGQFDDGPMVCDSRGSDSAKYHAHHAILHSRID